MKASKLIQDLARQISDHGDLEVMLVTRFGGGDLIFESRYILLSEDGEEIAIYGEEIK